MNVAGTAARDGVDTTVPGWLTNPMLYQSFVRPYCRSCHVAARQGLQFNSYAQLAVYGSIPMMGTNRLDSLLCRTAEMPHAQVPYLRLKQELFDEHAALELRLPRRELFSEYDEAVTDPSGRRI